MKYIKINMKKYIYTYIHSYIYICIYIIKYIILINNITFNIRLFIDLRHLSSEPSSRIYIFSKRFSLSSRRYISSFYIWKFCFLNEKALPRNEEEN